VTWAAFFKKYLRYKNAYLINGAYYENIDDDHDEGTFDTWDDMQTQLFSDSEEVELVEKVKKYDRNGYEIPEPEPLP
jgi:hypothetical protein